jgi:hypothetical protein
MLPFLKTYLNPDAEIIEVGFSEGFQLHFHGPPATYTVKNHKSAYEYADILQAKVDTEIKLSRILGPFKQAPLPNLRCSAVGLVPMKSNNPDPNSSDNWSFIHDLSTFPKDNSVNS